MTVSIMEPRVVEELSWTERQLPQNERTRHVHGLHPYLGKYVPQLVQYFLNNYFREARPSAAILDPFVGSGTTLVESNVAGRPSIGLDVSEFNVLLSRVKVSGYDLRELEVEVRSIISRTQEEARSKTRGQLDLYLQNGRDESNRTYQTDSGYLRSWYHPDALLPLLVFRDFIPHFKHQDFLRVLLSRAARSSRLAPHYELDFPAKPQTADYECYKHHRVCHPTTSSLPFISRYGKDMLRRVSEFQRVRTDAQAHAFCRDARSFDYSGQNLCGVITSPPYVGLIDYHEQHRYGYELLGLEDRSPEEIGRKSDGTGRTAIEKYKTSIVTVLKRIAGSGLKDPGLIVLVVNDKFNLYREIVERSGIEIVDRYRRRVDRRTGRRAGGFFEDILIFSG